MAKLVLKPTSNSSPGLGYWGCRVFVDHEPSCHLSSPFTSIIGVGGESITPKGTCKATAFPASPYFDVAESKHDLPLDLQPNK